MRDKLLEQLQAWELPLWGQLCSLGFPSTHHPPSAITTCPVSWALPPGTSPADSSVGPVGWQGLLTPSQVPVLGYKVRVPWPKASQNGPRCPPLPLVLRVLTSIPPYQGAATAGYKASLVSADGAKLGGSCLSLPPGSYSSLGAWSQLRGPIWRPTESGRQPDQQECSCLVSDIGHLCSDTLLSLLICILALGDESLAELLSISQVSTQRAGSNENFPSTPL